MVHHHWLDELLLRVHVLVWVHHVALLVELLLWISHLVLEVGQLLEAVGARLNVVIGDLLLTVVDVVGSLGEVLVALLGGAHHVVTLLAELLESGVDLAQLLFALVGLLLASSLHVLLLLLLASGLLGLLLVVLLGLLFGLLAGGLFGGLLSLWIRLILLLLSRLLLVTVSQANQGEDQYNCK
ncbi:hypothetical protein SAMD00019534_016630 [Acytostelium subglobosum LB1]|uniref:hypothetical protein n=1 Tax=Acytostelium subglobosum LB1 TaxID=1410327 RepID=UPI000644B669|nr:hypothetical protein SAMD00019534_016630 [Acytostelium subglobosum LB1]GAM18488.1 hypothetical protein SAMD00019534_016630 [Acytostelium subglobosum LB1]|eukprot:XP_012757708.1 hypothetical protein SAMD00019534_016630 [Acytostelium subglobosum LB1]